MKGKKTQKTMRSYAPHLAAAAVVMVLVTVLALFAPAYAATSGEVKGLSDADIGLSYSGDANDPWTASGTTITGEAKSKGGTCSDTHYSSTLTITNKYTTKAELRFSYTFNSVGSATVGGITAEKSGEFSKELDPNGSKQGAYTVEVSIKSGDTTAATELKITNLSLKPIIKYYDVTVKVPDDAMGTAYVDGKKLEQDVVYSQRANNVPLALKAEAKAGYRFVGWFDEKTEFFFSYDAEYTYYPERDADILPYFVEDGDPVFSVNGVAYYEFRTAMLASASEGQPAVLTRDYTLPDGNYTIPAAATLLLPYADGQTTIKGQSETLSFANATTFTGSITNAMLDIAYQRNKTLTIPAGVTIKNYGKIVVGGTIASTGGSYGGVCAGAHSNIQLDGIIEMTGANCILSAVGYIVGNGQIVTFEGTGAQLYQPFTICDFRGGSYTVTAAGNKFAGAKVETNESLVSPFIRYTARSIQVQTVIAYGSTMTGYCDLYANNDHNMTKTLLIGSGGLINLGAGSKAVCSYDANTYVAPYPAIGKTTIEISGGGSFGYLTLGVKVPILGTQEIKTNALIFPVPYNFDIQLNKGSYTIGYPVALLPGAGLYVAEDASLNVGNSASDFRILVLDG